MWIERLDDVWCMMYIETVMIRTQVYLPEDLHREAKLVAANADLTLSDLVRKGLLEVVRKTRKKKRKDPFKNFVGSISGGPKDLSAKIDYYLYGDGNPKWGKKKS